MFLKRGTHHLHIWSLPCQISHLQIFAQYENITWPGTKYDIPHIFRHIWHICITMAYICHIKISHLTRQTSCICDPARKTFSPLPTIRENASLTEKFYCNGKKGKKCSFVSRYWAPIVAASSLWETFMVDCGIGCGTHCGLLKQPERWVKPFKCIICQI